jgi:hypothetical protein
MRGFFGWPQHVPARVIRHSESTTTGSGLDVAPAVFGVGFGGASVTAGGFAGFGGPGFAARIGDGGVAVLVGAVFTTRESFAGFQHPSRVIRQPASRSRFAAGAAVGAGAAGSSGDSQQVPDRVGRHSGSAGFDVAAGFDVSAGCDVGCFGAAHVGSAGGGALWLHAARVRKDARVMHLDIAVRRRLGSAMVNLAAGSLH